MNYSTIINSIGLLVDIIGVIILFKYGLPSKINTPPKLLLECGLKKKEIKENRNIKKYAYFGLIFLLLGFVLQLISNFL